MITVYFGDDTFINQEIDRKSKKYNLDYVSYGANEIDNLVLLNIFKVTSDLFCLLSPALYKHKLDSRTSISDFINKILVNPTKNLKLPIAISDSQVIPNLIPEEVGTFLPKEYRKAERENLFRKLEKLDEGRHFWRNFETVRKQSELPWFELHKLLFADVSDDLGEIKKAKDRFFSYKKNKQVPPDEIIEKICKVFLVDREDFFKRSPSDLQNF